MSHLCSLNGFSSKKEAAGGHCSPVWLSKSVLPVLWLSIFTKNNLLEVPDADGIQYRYLAVSVSSAVTNASKVFTKIEGRFPDVRIQSQLRGFIQNLKAMPYRFMLLEDRELQFDDSMESYLSKRSQDIEGVHSCTFDAIGRVLSSRANVRFDSDKNALVIDEPKGSAPLSIDDLLVGQTEQDWTFFSEVRSGFKTVAPLLPSVSGKYLNEESRQQMSPRIWGFQALIPGLKSLTRTQWVTLLQMSDGRLKKAQLVWDPAATVEVAGARLGRGLPFKDWIQFVRSEETPHGLLLNVQNPPVQTSTLYRPLVRLIEQLPGVVIDKYGTQ